MYGSAWEKTCDGSPVLWVFTGTSTGGPCQVEKIVDLYTGGTNLGNQHQVSDDFDPTGIAGGLFFKIVQVIKQFFKVQQALLHCTIKSSPCSIHMAPTIKILCSKGIDIKIAF